MISARTRNNGVPNNGLILPLARGGIGPSGRHENKDLLGVPGEEGGEIGRQGEFDAGVFFSFGGVVVWTAAGAGDFALGTTCAGGRGRGTGVGNWE